MLNNNRKFELYNIVLRYLVFKVTCNLKRIYMDIDESSMHIILTAFYKNNPSELEIELLDDIVTNSNAPIPDFYIKAEIKIWANHIVDEKHDFIVFATHD